VALARLRKTCTSERVAIHTASSKCYIMQAVDWKTHLGQVPIAV
jgi:hypothetical protein